MGLIYSVAYIFGSIGGSIGSPFAGYIFDVTGGYRLAFLIGGVVCLLAAGIALLFLKAPKRWQKEWAEPSFIEEQQ